MSDRVCLDQETDALARGEEADRRRTTCGMYGEGHVLLADRLDDSDRRMGAFDAGWLVLLRNAFVSIDVFMTLETATMFGASYITAVSDIAFHRYALITYRYLHVYKHFVRFFCTHLC